MGSQEDEERVKENERIYGEIMAEKLTQFDKIHESTNPKISSNSNRMNWKRFTLRHIIIKPSKTKDREPWK